MNYITASLKKGVPLFCVQGEFNLSVACEFRQIFFAHLQQGNIFFIIDLTQATYINSAGINVLLEAYNEILSLDGGIRLIVCEKFFIKKVLRSINLSRYFEIFNNLQDALENLE